VRNPERAKHALERAELANDEIERSLWLVKAADHGIAGSATLVGGAAVNLHTGSYVPTDVDICAYLDEADRASLRALGFRHIQGDHFEFTFPDGETWPIEFPDSRLDGTVMSIRLDPEETLDVISLESLIVDRLLQATDGNRVTFDEAVRLVAATITRADWDTVEEDVNRRETAGLISGLTKVKQDVLERVRQLMGQ
jgi:hypothetical protein